MTTSKRRTVANAYQRSSEAPPWLRMPGPASKRLDEPGRPWGSPQRRKLFHSDCGKRLLLKDRGFPESRRRARLPPTPR
jgi:hypothetical protein